MKDPTETPTDNKVEDLDMLNLYVKELREPTFCTDIRNKTQIERVYNRSYLPNG
jgi:hypothetical protein